MFHFFLKNLELSDEFANSNGNLKMKNENVCFLSLPIYTLSEVLFLIRTNTC